MTPDQQRLATAALKTVFPGTPGLWTSNGGTWYRVIEQIFEWQSEGLTLEQIEARVAADQLRLHAERSERLSAALANQRPAKISPSAADRAARTADLLKELGL